MSQAENNQAVDSVANPAIAEAVEKPSLSVAHFTQFIRNYDYHTSNMSHVGAVALVLQRELLACSYLNGFCCKEFVDSHYEDEYNNLELNSFTQEVERRVTDNLSLNVKLRFDCKELRCELEIQYCNKTMSSGSFSFAGSNVTINDVGKKLREALIFAHGQILFDIGLDSNLAKAKAEEIFDATYNLDDLLPPPVQPVAQQPKPGPFDDMDDDLRF